MPYTPYNPSLLAPSPVSIRPKPLLQDRLANQNIIHNRYLLEKTIGKGSYGKVKLAIDLQDPQRMCRRALKFIAIDSVKKPAHVTRLRRETVLLRCLNHPHLVKLTDHFQTNDDLVLVLEHVNGQDLFDRITKHPQQRLPEPEARAIFRQLVSALHYCHHHNVVHRDIKPENVMLTEAGVVKLIDFGFANWFDQLESGKHKLETNCGSPLYAAPEIVRGQPYRGPEVDCWSLGVVLVAMLTGSLPFEDDALKVLYEKICRGSYTLPKYVSPQAADLIARMLVVDGQQRATILEIREHPWVKEGFGNAPDPYIPVRRPLSMFDPTVIRSMSVDLNMDIQSVRQELMARPNHGAFACLYRLYQEQMDREGIVKSSQQQFHYTAPAADSCPDWVRVSKIDVNEATVGLLKFDCDYLMRCVNRHIYEQQRQTQPSNEARSSKRKQSSDVVHHPQPSPHSNFIQQAVGHLNSQFKRIKNMINQTDV